MLFNSRFAFDDYRVACSNCKYFSPCDMGLSDATKLDLMSEQARQQQPLRPELGACVRNPPSFMTRPGMIGVNTPHGQQQALANIPSPSFPIVHKARKCGEFEPAGFITNPDGSISIVEMALP